MFSGMILLAIAALDVVTPVWEHYSGRLFGPLGENIQDINFSQTYTFNQ